MARGKFIVLEGIDGAGINTQAELLAQYLKSKGKKVLVTKEPTNRIIGGLIRGFLTGDWSVDPKTAQLLFAADRSEHLKKVILPALKKGHWVICDRYILSSIAYGSLDLDRKWLEAVNSQFIEPDVTFVIHVPPKVSLKRIKGSRFGLELFEKEKLLTKVIKNYFDASRDFKNVYLINGFREIEKVHDEIVRYLEKQFKL